MTAKPTLHSIAGAGPKKASQPGAMAGLGTGVAMNIFIWQFYGKAVSWLWWNPIGFFTSFFIG